MGKANKDAVSIRGDDRSGGLRRIELNFDALRSALRRLKELNIRLFIAKEEVAAAERINLNWKAQADYAGYAVTSDAPYSDAYLAQRKRGIEEHEKERAAIRTQVAQTMKAVALYSDMRQPDAMEQFLHMAAGCDHTNPKDSWQKGIADAESVGNGNAVPSKRSPGADKTTPETPPSNEKEPADVQDGEGESNGVQQAHPLHAE